MKVTFTEDALKEYFEWQNQDKKTVKKINDLIKDIQRNGMMAGIGKPELRNNILQGALRRLKVTDTLSFLHSILL